MTFDWIRHKVCLCLVCLLQKGSNMLHYDTAVLKGIRVPRWTSRTLSFWSEACEQAMGGGYALYTILSSEDVPGWNFTPLRRAFCTDGSMALGHSPVGRSESIDMYYLEEVVQVCCGRKVTIDRRDGSFVNVHGEKPCCKDPNFREKSEDFVFEAEDKFDV